MAEKLKMIDMGKIVFATFADSRYGKAMERIKKETENFGFDERYFFSERDLPKDFFKGFSPKIYRRGYGYWIWKPYIVSKMMSRLNDGDILVYTDAGTQWHISGRKRFEEYVGMLNEERPIVVFQQPYLVKDWTKVDVLKYICPDDWKKYAMTLQFCGGIHLSLKCFTTENLFAEWNYITQNHRDLVTDKASLSQNLQGFQENRHDQSIFTLLVKKIPHNVVSWEEVESLDNDWTGHDKFPLWAKRDKGERLMDKIKRKVIQCLTIWIGLYLKYCKGFYFRNKIAW